MTMQELEQIMVEYGIVIRAIPHYQTSTFEARHKDQYPEAVEYFDVKCNRSMIKVQRPNRHGGKFLITKQADTGQMVSFHNPKYYDSIEDAVNAFLTEHKTPVKGCPLSAELIVDVNGNKCRKIDAWKEEGCLYTLLQDIEEEQFFYVIALESMQDFAGKYTYEFDHEPAKQEIEDRHVSNIAAIAIDRNEAKVM